ncbi:integrin beta-PS isoform X1 [Anopheles aquasalis]|nr:integrin beta-PS isoform X1 [Anopheles aquasalis]XP_050083382.1 integrin beta-PS isoform X1 [Anopheles aquasalis]
MRQLLLVFAVAAVQMVVLLEQAASESYPVSTCPGKSTCGQCIQTKNCRWCKDPNFTQPRCHGQIENYCAEEFTVDPSNSFTLIQGHALSKASGGAAAAGTSESQGSFYSQSHQQSSSSSSSFSQQSSSSSSSSSAGSIVQISPQRVGLQLRLNEVYNLHVNYARAEDYPVDLYYLMDLSKSMEDDKEKLSSLGAEIAREMRGITSNFRLGFGSFVDKVLMPYVSTVPKNLLEPCSGCVAPYGYHNLMQLSSDANRFTEEVRNANVSGNLDAPEGGFDAIMQAIVCREQIGWREQARRLLLFSTDAGFHYAGDGKLGGVITPNDGECHLDKDGWYTHWDRQDYPSISQINLKVKENAINVIFAVTLTETSVYEKLSELVEGSSVAMLSEDSSNIVSLVAEQYKKISSSVELKDNRTDNVIDVKYWSRCLGNTLTQTNRCDGLKVGEKVTFEAHITLTKCPEDPRDWKQVLQIYPVGINESLTVDIEMLCSCPCEHPSDPGYQVESPQCNGQGTLKCGICECNNQHHGLLCECSHLGDGSTEPGVSDTCRMSNSTEECSNRGHCVCGVCQCEQRVNKDELITGKFCECDNFSCERRNGLLCSGEDHGRCVCGQCECREGWTGQACDCQSSNDTCMPPDGGEICSGHGTCECGVCRCAVTEEGRYTGWHCEKCPTCSGRCNEFKHCVQCQMYKTGPLYPDGCENCTFTPRAVEKVTIDEERNDNKCTFYDEDDCRFEFSYNDRENAKNPNIPVEVHAQQERECPPKVFMLGIVLAVIAAVVLIGMAVLLLWKVLTSIHDRREFARFEKERMMAKWDTGENPIYKQATTTFKNPTYAGK